MNKIVMGFPGTKCSPKLMNEDLAILSTIAVLNQACLFFVWIKLQSTSVLPVKFWSFYQAYVSPKFIYGERRTFCVFVSTVTQYEICLLEQKRKVIIRCDVLKWELFLLKCCLDPRQQFEAFVKIHKGAEKHTTKLAGQY